MIDPIFLHFLTASLHLILIAVVLVSWLSSKFMSNEDENQNYNNANDVVSFKNHKHLPAQFWASDIVSVVMSLIFCCSGVWSNLEGSVGNLEEPLLNGVESEKPAAKGDETVSPFVKADMFSCLMFSWMDYLISLGQKTMLNLDDIPQLAISDSVKGAFSILNNKLEACSRGSNTVTSLMLAKGLYLNGRREFKIERYVLASAFSIVKLLECIAQRHWYFKAEQGKV
ncbi:hypothetical protein C2S53_011553 [Perilla frutescens var. hirtella]|uniref:Uncharacterized protein n=1 Tax=Perilla frutescens var. hirtella TaxID=608512 RepID=A0AAD4P715_PERFH|nr:hypothetical protein C2S53_011553 [Perilla frutescens var. hirtella]